MMQNIFYSWQSDLPKTINLNAIRMALREAASLIEHDDEDNHLIIDEATRDTPGSPNIPFTIFDKIRKADIFICDLTTINENSDTRKVPNPNVLIELGFAIAILGWERIILLFNTNFGSFPSDLPFDIAKHRATPFEINDKNDREGKKKLSRILKESIEIIIKKSPLKPNEDSESEEEKKHKNDLKNISRVLSSIHLGTFDLFVEEFPIIIRKHIIFFEEDFRSKIDSSLYHIYDEKLNKLLQKMKKDWSKALSYGEHYKSLGNGDSKFDNVFFTDEERYNKNQEIYKLLFKLRDVLKKDIANILKYVRENYIEIDIDDLSKQAYENYKSYFQN